MPATESLPAPPAAPAAPAAVNVSTLPKPATPPAPAKAGSARAGFEARLNKRFGGETEPTPKVERPGAETTIAESPPPETKTDAEPPPDKSGTTTAAPEAEPKGKKVSPWKLVDEFKARAATAEARALDLEKKVMPEAQAKAHAQELDQLRAQAKALTEELRFYSAEKYDPDVQAADAAYTNGWKRAMKELGEITLTDPATQQARAVTAEDLTELVNLPLGTARDIADQIFGKFADDVMNHRKEIKNLLEAKDAAREELKKTGATRAQQRAEQMKAQTAQVAGFIKTEYEKAINAALADEKTAPYFKARDGDTEWNTRLEKGFKLVDRAYSENPMDRRLTPEQRADVVRRHAAVRNRAASWGALRHANEKLQSQITALEKELKQYKGSTPGAGGRSAPAAKETVKGMAGLFNRIAERGKPN